MKNRSLFVFSLLLFLTVAGCGYTTSSMLDKSIRTIHVDPFVNKISYTTEGGNRNLYIPLLEVDIQKAVIDHYLFDGNLKVAEPEGADLLLKAELINYDRRPLRYTDGDDVEEYRIYLRVSLKLLDNRSGEIVWKEPNFVGESTYFVTGPLAKSEDVAIEDAITDLARRIVERTVENW